MSSRHRSLAARVPAVILLVVFSTGCSLVNPFVFPERPRPGATEAATGTSALEALRRVDAAQSSEAGVWQDSINYIEAQSSSEESLAGARARSTELKRRYEGAVGDQAKLNASMGIALIPLTAAAIGLGATGGSAAAIVALSAAGAAGYGTATWLSSKPRQMAYLAGLKAITCAEDAVKPLDMSLADRVQLESDIRSLNVAIRRVESLAGQTSASADRAATRVAGAGQSTTPQLRALAGAQREYLKSVDGHVRAARDLASSAQDAHASGVKLQQTISAAGGKLGSAIDDIAAEVGKLVAETQRDPEALANIINGLGGAYKMFAAVPAQVQPRAAEAGSEIRAQSGRPRATGVQALSTEEQALEQALLTDQDQIAAQLATLYDAVAAMSSYRRAVAARVNPIAEGAQFERLKACGVKADTTVADLVIDPAGPFEFTKGKPGAKTFSIKGGMTPFDARLVAGATTGITVENDPPFSRTVFIRLAAEAAAGDYALVVRDGSGRSATAIIKVTTSTEAPGTERTSAVDSADRKDLEDIRAAVIARGAILVKGVTLKVKNAVIKDPATPAGRPALEVELDYDSGQPSGTITEPDLVKAVKAIEDRGLDSSQFAIKDYQTLAAQIPTTAADAGLTPQSGRPRRSSEAVFAGLAERRRQQVQLALCLTGVQVDGKWGPITQGALRSYQRARGLDPDGILTPALADALTAERDAVTAQRCGAGR